MKRSTIQKADRINAVARELTELKKQIEADRIASIKEKLEINSRAVETQNSYLLRLAESRRNGSKTDQTKNKIKINLDNEVCIYEGSDLGFTDKDITNFQEEFPSAGVIVSHSRNKKSTIKFAKLPFVEQIPRYTTWIFSSRNQMMAEGQSAFNQRQIYYDPSDKETLICSDSEEEIPETEREKIFSEGEDLMLWEIIKKHGLIDDVLDQLCQFIDASSSKIRERYENLLEKPKPLELTAPFSYESLAAAMDSFDAIFCRRCLVFFCNLHECPSALIIPSVKLSSSIPDAGSGPCENLCYMKDAIESQVEAEALTFSNNTMTDKSGKRKAVEEHEMGPSEIPAGEFGVCYQKRKKRVPISDAVSLINEEIRSMSLDGAIKMDLDARERGGSFAMNDNPHLNRCSKEQKSQAWSTMEKDLYSMGVEIFGKDSCLITRNLLSGLKTCEEVRNYMIDCDSVVTDDKSLRAENIGVDANQKEEEKRRTQILRRRGRSRKLRYTWKSASHPYIRKRVINGKSDVNIRYTPCACQPICGKQCPCRLNSTFCQKYCGCFNRCKYHFKGCHCGKSQCRTRQCPCFASNRECDPDICKYCWISCGDGSLGEPPARGESLGCGNMKLLLKQKQRILIAKSDVAGWGAFTQNALNKDDYLGEYTGELISHREADKRGKIYDRANSSYLFDLNDEYVLDAFRKGDKLKFANHSSNPNCYAKVMLVGSEHKVGIYAKERIEAGDELFYDYGYGPNIAPSWARKLEDSNIDEAVPPIARAKKVA